MDEYQYIFELFGQKVRSLRHSLGISQEEFASRCGLDRTYISSLERGHRNVSLKNIAVLAFNLNVTISELLEGIVLSECED